MFLAAAAAEAVSAVFFIAKGPCFKKTWDIFRIAELGVFCLLGILGIVQFSFGWIAFVTLLLVMAVIGAVDLIRKGREKIEYRPKHTVPKALGMIVLIFLAALPAIVFPGYKMLEPAGPYGVKTDSYTFTDAGRIETFTDTGENRTVNIGLWYPENGDGKYPLIVFSHGGMSVMTSNESLYSELASHGYVVCSVAHPYHSLYTSGPEGKTVYIDSGYMRELNAEDAKTNKRQSLEYYRKWMKIRTDDMNFVIGRILSEAEKEDAKPVYRLIDTSKIGVMGHSLGGSAALGVGRMRDDIGAVIALESPFMCDITGVENGEFVFTDDDYPVPVLNVYSDSAWGSLSEWPQYAENFRLISKSDAEAFNVYIKGAGHFTLTDLALTSPVFTEMLNGFKATADTDYCLRTINKVCLDFFDAYLKESGEFKSDGVY
jgi:dienelactone hydrolase